MNNLEKMAMDILIKMHPIGVHFDDATKRAVLGKIEPDHKNQRVLCDFVTVDKTLGAQAILMNLTVEEAQALADHLTLAIRGLQEGRSTDGV